MKNSVRSVLLRYGITAACGAAIVLLVLDLHGYSSLTTDLERYRLLSNAFTIPGTVILMIGLLVLISGTGIFDGLSYVLNWLRLTLLPFGKQERYYDHVQRRHARKTPNGLFLIIVGAAYLAVAIVFLVLFYTIYKR